MRKLRENLEYGDLKRMVHNELHVDEFKSKLGDDKDVCVISFKVAGKEPGLDLVGFIEKGFEWVLDADVSSGEMRDGDYVVFIETERTPELSERIMNMMTSVCNLTGHELEDWRVRYYHSQNDFDLEADVLDKLIPNTPEEYKKRYGEKSDEEIPNTDNDTDMDKLRTAAGITSKKKAPDNAQTRSLKVAAGII